jgi:hypothetical protein
MRGVRALIILTVLALAVSNALPAFALCVTGTPLCQTFWSYEAVFEGTVVSIDQKAAGDSASPFQSRLA